MELLREILMVKPMDGYRLMVSFDTGEAGIYDATPLLQYPCYRRLKNLSYFRQAHTERGTVVWPNDEDIAPEMLWEQSVKQ